MAKSSQTFLVYFAELCTYIIPNVSNNVPTRDIFNLLEVAVCFIGSPVALTSWRQSEKDKGRRRTTQRNLNFKTLPCPRTEMLESLSIDF